MKFFEKLIMAAALGLATLSLPAFADGSLTVAVPANLNTLDPAKAKQGEEYIVGYMLFSGLVEVDGIGGVKPDLAESWTTSEDNKTWTFHLRKGVKFHDGRELEAADVKASIERVMDKSVGSTARVNFDIVDKIETPDQYTVVFDLNIPYSGFAEILGERQARILPRDKFDTISERPIGTGPFKFVSFMPGDKVEFERNADYYNQDQPKLDNVTIRIMPESASQIAALESGDIDLIWSVPVEAVKSLSENDEFVTASVPTSSWDGLIMNNSVEPFDDPRVRKAVLMALDKTALVEFSLYGYGTPTLAMIPPVHAYYNAEIDATETDLDGSRALLAEAGYPDGFTITLYLPAGRPTRERLGIAAKELLREVGITVDLQRVPWDKFIDEIEGKSPFFVDGFYSRPTIDTSIYPFFHSSGSWNSNLWHYNNPDVDAVLDQARAATTEEQRADLYKKFQALTVENPAGVIPYIINHIDAYRSNVKGFEPSAMMWLDLRNTTVE